MGGEFDDWKPVPIRGKTLTKLAWSYYGIRRGWFESDKGLRLRILWHCFGGNKGDLPGLPPISRGLARIRRIVAKARGTT